ncbi:hypothetical protein [Diaminobutyricimonas sp. TR449]|uniref:hypothetical protein n=1 Tax=Diaminobutyricimonas sp. TR449 TaxID=2708076 RepID=UPI0014215A92|nr:hypothetical protein [Diaminobutyricimonas sp. TR449]
MTNFFTRRRDRKDRDREDRTLYSVWFSVVPGGPGGTATSGGTSSGAPALVARQSVAARSMTADELEGMQSEQREAVFDFILERGLICDEYWVVEGVDRVGGRDGLGSHRGAPIRLTLDGGATPDECERVLRQFQRRDRADDVLRMVNAAVATEDRAKQEGPSPVEGKDHVLQLSVTAGEEDFAIYVEIAATAAVGSEQTQIERDRACQDLRHRVWDWIADNRILDDGYHVDEAAYHRSNPAGGFGDRSVWTPEAMSDEERLAEIRDLATDSGVLEWAAEKLRTRDSNGRKAERTLRTKVDGYEPGVVIM